MRGSRTLVFALAFSLVGASAWAEAATDSEKSPSLALGLSIGGPLAGYGMILASTLPSGHIQTWQTVALTSGVLFALVGPSTGHFYANGVGRGLAFSGGRLLLALLGSMAFAEGMDHEDVSEADYDKDIVRRSNIEIGLCAAGILALSVWESIDTYYSTKRGHLRSVAIAPMMVREREGVSLAGLSLAGTY